MCKGKEELNQKFGSNRSYSVTISKNFSNSACLFSLNQNDQMWKAPNLIPSSKSPLCGKAFNLYAKCACSPQTVCLRMDSSPVAPASGMQRFQQYYTNESAVFHIRYIGQPSGRSSLGLNCVYRVYLQSVFKATLFLTIYLNYGCGNFIKVTLEYIV